MIHDPQQVSLLDLNCDVVGIAELMHLEKPEPEKVIVLPLCGSTRTPLDLCKM